MTNERLADLDWDTITGLFDRVGALKTTHVDTPTVTRSWAARPDYDPFCPGGNILHNRALALFLSPNMNPLIETDHPELKNFVFSAVVVFKPASQNTCDLVTGVNRLLDFFDKEQSSMALVSLSDTADYFPYPDEADRVDYAVVPADNLHTRSVGPASSFMCGRLIRVEIKGVTHVVLPPAFEKDLGDTNISWVPCPVRGNVWANEELVDVGGENLTHETAVADPETYREDPGDKIRRSALGLRPVPLCKVTHLYDIESLGLDTALDFMSRVRSTTAPRTEVPMQVDDGPEDGSTPQGKTNDKCKPKSSANLPDSTGTQQDSGVGTSGATAPQETETIDVADEADSAGPAEEEEVQTEVPPDDLSPNQLKELLHDLMRKSRILDDCRNRVRSAVSKAVVVRTKAMFKPFTGYIDDIGREVSSWHAGVLSIRPQMVDCSYEKYRENSGLIREKTNAFYERARALNKTLDKHAHPSSSTRDDSGILEADTDVDNDSYQTKITDIMTDVEKSVEEYANEMAKKVLELTGGADISSYLGHIFSTGLNFQTSMWQLVTFEAVYLPTVMREQLRRDASTLRIFVECLPTLAPCAIPPPPFPTASAVQTLLPPTTSASQPSSSTVVDGVAGPAETSQAVPTSSAPQTSAATTPTPVAAPRTKLKISPAATNTALDKAVGRVMPVRDTHPGSTLPSASSGRLAGLAQASSTVRSRPRGEISPNSQPTVKRPRMEGATEPSATTSSTPGSSSAAAISVDDDDDEIQFVDATGDDASVRVDAHGTQTTTSPFIPGALDDELVAEFSDQVKRVVNSLRRNHYSTDFPWMQELRRKLPQGDRNGRNVDSMVAHVLAVREDDPYVRKSFVSVESILKGDEDPGFFDEDFKKTLANVRRNQHFKSPAYAHLKSFQFDYILACFLDEDGNSFPANDKRFRTQMLGLSSLHSVAALSRPKILAHSVSIERIFCPHCGYFVNNPYTMSAHIRMHYRAGMFCAHKGCNYITNRTDGMQEHGESKHSYGTRRTPSKAKK